MSYRTIISAMLVVAFLLSAGCAGRVDPKTKAEFDEALKTVWKMDWEKASAMVNANPELVKLCDKENVSLLYAASGRLHCRVDEKDMDGRIAFVRLLLSKGAKVGAVKRGAVPPTYAAANAGYLKVMKVLLENGADVHWRDKSGWTLVHAAWPYEAVIRFLVEKGVDINVCDKGGRTVMHKKVAYGNPYGVSTLVGMGGDINARTKNGETPLFFAGSEMMNYNYGPHETEAGPKGLVEEMVKCGAKANVKNKDGLTPLHIVVRWGQDAAARCLIDKGADVNATTKDGVTPLHCLLGKELELPGRSRFLCFSMLRGRAPNIKAAELLIAKGADVKAVDEDGNAPLHYLAGDTACSIVELMVARGADVNAKNKAGKTPLDCAKERNDSFAVKLLKKCGAK